MVPLELQVFLSFLLSLIIAGAIVKFGLKGEPPADRAFAFLVLMFPILVLLVLATGA